MRPRKSLTGKQQAFARLYAILGNGVRAAKLAGYKNGPGIWVAASRLMKDDKVCLEIERFREYDFTDLRMEITQKLHREIMAGLVRNNGYRRSAKALKLSQKMGLFQYYDAVSEGIRALEERYGCDFGVIVGTLAEVEQDPDLIQACQAIRAPKTAVRRED